MKGRFPAPRAGGEWRLAQEALFARNYNFALINTRFYPLSLWAAKQCAGRGIPVAVLEHGTKHLSLDNALLDMAGNAYEHAAMRAVRRYCGAFYGVSQAASSWLGHFGVASRGQLYNAVNPAALAAEAAAHAFDVRARYGFAADAPLVLFTGRLIREKGVWELLRAFELLGQSHPGARLLVVGNGPLAEALRQKAPRGLVFAGELPHGESLAAIAAADVFCLPTYSEGFSTAVLEAAALGACIVTTATGGSPELIRDGESGVLLAGRQPEAIALALGRALENPLWRAEAGRRAQEAVNEKFTWEHTAQKLVAVARQSRPGAHPQAKDGSP